ncbi:MAG: 4'-phosphopantetheinyl transferase superfamily protein [Chitinophagaceae bacterium]
MKSIGNDIVALNAVDLDRTQSRSFYSKILADSEMSLYQGLQEDFISFSIYVWLVWSIKEAAFKFLKRNFLQLIFSPTKIIIQHVQSPALRLLGKGWTKPLEKKGCTEGFYHGRLSYGAHILYFRSMIDQECIHSIVQEQDNFDHIWFGIQIIKEHSSYEQSCSVREFILTRLKCLFPGDELRIDQSSNGIPILSIGMKNDIYIPVSLAHHDGFIAYSFLFN